MPHATQVNESDMPQLFRSADLASLNGQGAFVNGTRLRLFCVVAAALAGVFTWRVGKGDYDLWALLAVVLFVGALVIEGLLWRHRPDRSWYDARAVAESAKTLAWKYAVGAEPFPTTLPAGDAVRQLVARLDAVRNEYKDLELTPIESPIVTDWMNAQRKASWDDRKSAYLEQRVREQRGWYKRGADKNKRRSNQWRAALIGLEFAGFIFALAEVLEPDMPAFTPALAALVGAVVAWVEVKQHDFNSRAYSAAVYDLTRAEAKLLAVEDEAEWAQEVNDAEDAISREHVGWLASRSQL